MSTNIKCPDCDETRPTRSSLVYHISGVHHGPATPKTATVDERLEQAGRDIADLKRQLDGLVRQIDRPDPVQARNSVLYEVWNQLMDVGETSAARLVRTMWDGS